MVFEQALYCHAHCSASALLLLPVYRAHLAHLRGELLRDSNQLVVSLAVVISNGLWLRQRLVEREFLVSQPKVLGFLVLREHLLGHLEHLLEHLGVRELSVQVAIHHALHKLGVLLCLRHALLAITLDLVINELLQ